MYHTVDICQGIAEKFRSPEALQHVMEDEIKRGIPFTTKWPNLTLASGLPGIVCFYAAMDRAFPDQKWDKVAHQYLKIIVQTFEIEGVSAGYSLFYGLTGICFAGHLCSKESRYTSLLNKLNTVLINEIEQNLAYLDKNFIQTDNDITPSHYNLTEGLSGVIAYLMLRQEDRAFQKIAADCINTLIALLEKEKVIDNHRLSSWFVSQENEILETANDQFSNGGFILSTPFNIVGCLSVLSLAAWNGNTSQSLYKMIRRIATWLCEQQIKIPEGISWPYIVPFDPNKENSHSSSALSQGTWSYGRPAVAKSLYLAGRSLQDKSLMALAEDSFVSQFVTRHPKNLEDPSMSFGTAGLLASTYFMAKLTNHSTLFKQVSRLEQEVQSAYHPNLPFGFQRTDGLGHRQLNDLGLFNGAAGSALSLLLVAGLTDQVPWERAFLLR